MDIRRIWRLVRAPIGFFVLLVGLLKALTWKPVKDRLDPVGDWLTESSLGLPRYAWLIAGLLLMFVVVTIAFEGLVRVPGRIRVGDRVRIPWMFGEMEGRVTRVWGPPGRRHVDVELPLPGGDSATTPHAVDSVRLAPPRFRFLKPRLGPELEPPF
jgi:hypothetical protein